MERLQKYGSENFSSSIKEVWKTTSIIKKQSLLKPEIFLERHKEEIKQVFPGSLKKAQETKAIPVMICARNEESNIGRTLYGLSRSTIQVQPIVIDNGSVDNTGSFAAILGAEVVYEKKPGLLNALRSGFRYFKENDYTGPILLTDADSVPLPSWAESMTRFAEKELPGGGEAFGRIFHYDFDGRSHILRNAIFSTGTNLIDLRSLKQNNPRAHGPNGIIMTDFKGRILDGLSELSESSLLAGGLGTDIAVRDQVRAFGGHISFNWNLSSTVITSGRRYPRIVDLAGRAMSKEKVAKRVYRNWGE
jgi:glycosyltransferase involved in cell wall biosynthesis